MTRLSNTVSELLKDEFFVKWVLNPDKESDEFWKRWIQQHPNNDMAVRKARELILSFQIAGSNDIPEVDYNRILDNLLQYNNLNKPSTNVQLPKRSWKVASVAAIACSVMLIGLYVGLFTSVLTPSDTLSKIEYVTKTAPLGVKATISLPDGSTVKLNSLSEIRYPAKFSDSIREVFITGQAFFEIKKNPLHPFVVHTNEFSTTVLGTSFDIKAFEDQDQHHVAVLTGKVKVATTSGINEILVKNEMIIYEKSNHMAKKMGYDYDAIMGWKDGILNFERATFREVCEKLSRWYGVEFELEDSLEIKGNYTGSFKNESLDNVLMGISFSSQFNYEIKSRTVIIK